MVVRLADMVTPLESDGSADRTSVPYLVTFETHKLCRDVPNHATTAELAAHAHSYADSYLRAYSSMPEQGLDLATRRENLAP